jgi:hypothetical protein
MSKRKPSPMNPRLEARRASRHIGLSGFVIRRHVTPCRLPRTSPRSLFEHMLAGLPDAPRSSAGRTAVVPESTLGLGWSPSWVLRVPALPRSLRKEHTLARRTGGRATRQQTQRRRDESPRHTSQVAEANRFSHVRLPRGFRPASRRASPITARVDRPSPGVRGYSGFSSSGPASLSHARSPE